MLYAVSSGAMRTLGRRKGHVLARVKKGGRSHSAEVTNPGVKLQQRWQIRNPKSGTKLAENVNWQGTWEKVQQYHLPFLELYKWVSNFLIVHIIYNPNSFVPLTLLIFLLGRNEWPVSSFSFCSLFIPFLQDNLATIYCAILFQTGVCFLAPPANSVPESRW